MADLQRRTTSPVSANYQVLPENQFWSQAQSHVLKHLQANAANAIYVPVFLPNGKPLSREICEFVSVPGATPCLLLVGEYGVGKTSALLHFKKTCEAECVSTTADGVVYVDGNLFASEISSHPGRLLECIGKKVALHISDVLARRKIAVDEYHAALYKQDPEFADRRLYRPIASKANLRRAFADYDSNPVSSIGPGLRFLARLVAPQQVALILDNIDPFSIELQKEAVRRATQLGVSCDLKAIVAVRTTSLANLLYHDPGIVSTFVRTVVPAAPPGAVIHQRIKLALAEPATLTARLGEGAIRYEVRECPEFAEILVNALGDPEVEQLIRGLSGNSVREMLALASKIYSSHFLDARRMTIKLSPAGSVSRAMWRDNVPYHVVMRALTLRNFPIYHPDLSSVPNLFGTHHSATHVGPFCRLLLLRFFQRYTDEVPLDEACRQVSSALGIDAEIVHEEHEWLADKYWVTRRDSTYTGITTKGRFALGHLAVDTEYLTHIATDVDLPTESEQTLISPADLLSARLHNLCVLLECLVKLENRMLLELSSGGLSVYVDHFGSRCITSGMLDSTQRSLGSIRNKSLANTEAQESVAHSLARVDILRRLIKCNDLIQKYATS